MMNHKTKSFIAVLLALCLMLSWASARWRI